MVSTTMPPIKVLLVEDNLDDVLLMVEALKDPLWMSLTVARDGQEAMELLRHRGRFAHAPLPHLILLDLNLPKKDGREVLSEIKADEELKAIPVIILSTSQDEQDIRMCYQSYANSYITKPVDIDQFSTVMQTLREFWLKVAHLPS